MGNKQHITVNAGVTQIRGEKALGGRGMKEIWSIKDNGGKGKLVGIVSNKSNWFIAESVLLKHAEFICDMFNASQQAIEEDAELRTA